MRIHSGTAPHQMAFLLDDQPNETPGSRLILTWEEPPVPPCAEVFTHAVALNPSRYD